MKPNRILLEFSGTPVEELPEEVRAQVEADPALKQAMEAQARVARRIGLKRYERPPEALEGRVRERLRIRIVNERSTRPSFDIDALPDWVRMTAAVVVMLSLSVWTHREMLRNNPEPPTGPLVARPEIQPGNDGLDEYEFTHVDPFTTLVSFPRARDTGPLFPGPFFQTLDPAGPPHALEVSPLFETNRLETAPTIPVLFPYHPGGAR